MAFNVVELTTFAFDAIADFASRHGDETFYGFAIDADLLCLNSIEQFRTTLAGYQTRWGAKYQSAEAIADLRSNTGDWTYQGFARFEGLKGWDEELYDDHYNIGLDDPTDPVLKSTPYAKAMDAVVQNLRDCDAFAGLRRTLDFKAESVEHNY